MLSVTMLLMKIRFAIIAALPLLCILAAACSGPQAPAAAVKGPEIAARQIKLETADFTIAAEKAGLDGSLWKLEKAEIETRTTGNGLLKLMAPLATFDMQSGRIEADGGIKATLGRTQVRAGRISLDSAADSFRMEGELSIDAPGLSLSGKSLQGHISAAADFEVDQPRLRLTAPDGE